MISMQVFVHRIGIFHRSSELLIAECCETPLNRGEAAVYLWEVVSATQPVFHYFEKSPFVAVIYPDGSAQLLSRDEDECLLFAALWELGK